MALGTSETGLSVHTAANIVNAYPGAVTYEAKMLDNGRVCTAHFGADAPKCAKRKK